MAPDRDGYGSSSPRATANHVENVRQTRSIDRGYNVEVADATAHGSAFVGYQDTGPRGSVGRMAATVRTD